MMEAFDHTPRTRLVFGEGSAARTGELAHELVSEEGPVLVVTDPGIVAAGHTELVTTSLQDAGLHVHVFDQTHENPTTEDVDACLAVARDVDPRLIIGLGGGSSLDTAKGCNFLLTNGGRMQDYWGVGKAARPMLPLIAIPTTAGTGSETQSFALIADAQTHRKMACGDPKAAAGIAILDPLLTLTQPPWVTACTGVDAIAHAVESFVCTRRHAVSSMFARESFRLTMHHLPRVLNDGRDLEARGGMLLGAALAGLAIENSMLGAAHAAANPLTANYGLVHGRAVGVMLPHVVRFNAHDPAARDRYAELANAAGIGDVNGLVETIEAVLMESGLGGPLTELGADPADGEKLAENAAKQWTAGFNPRPVAARDFAGLYQAAGL